MLIFYFAPDKKYSRSGTDYANRYFFSFLYKLKYLMCDTFILDSEWSEGSYGFTMMFIFFSVNTFSDSEWSEGSYGFTMMFFFL